VASGEAVTRLPWDESAASQCGWIISKETIAPPTTRRELSSSVVLLNLSVELSIRSL
jgi:hypothetical protein